MHKKILEKLKEINLKSLFRLEEDLNLIDSKSILDLKIDKNNVTMVVDLFPLNINKEDTQKLERVIRDQIEKPSFSIFRKTLKLYVVFTSSKELKSSKKLNTANNNQNNSPKPSIDPVPNVKNIIVIASGKGGVGKSTIAVNLALSLKRIGYNVGLVDGDIYGPSIGHMMNLSGKPQIEDNLMIPIESYGIECMSISSLIEKDHALVFRGPMITKTINQLIKGVKWGNKDKEIDHLIIDLPPGTGDVHISICQQFPISGAVIVSTPQDIAVIDAIKAIDMFKKLNVPIKGVVQNMSYLLENNNKNYIFGKDKAKEMAEKYQINFLGDIELDVRIREGADNKNPVVNKFPSSRIAISYGKIAESIIEKI